MFIDGKDIYISGKFIKIASLANEWFEDIEDPPKLISELKLARPKPGLFSFWQRLPYTEPDYGYHMVPDNLAVLPISTFDHWWSKQINAKTRNVARKAQKKGVEIRLSDFDESLIQGITEIFNESPIRQGRPFWHYGKDKETIKQEMSDRLDASGFIGAYFQNELIGFIKLLYTDRYAMMVEILSKLEHRDKSPTNALLAKAVEICAEKNIHQLVYSKWITGSLGDFKRHNGFEKIGLPRYYIPLNLAGHIILKSNLHHGVDGIIPVKLKDLLIKLRKQWYSRK